MTDLPAGTVTLLFTDIEGSTTILGRLGSRYGEVLSLQRRILRSAIARWDGVEMGTEGDSFFVVFRTVGQAIAAARQAQEDLVAAAWPDGAGVRVRMGLHTGEPTLHEDGYVGMDVHRAARVAGAAHGGQVVLTEATYRIAVDRRTDDVAYLDLGRHRLKDLPDVEHLFQLQVAGLPAAFPPLRSLGSAANLPTPPTSLIGRDREVTDLVGRLTPGAGRLTTLVGTGGTGKTRLALAGATAARDHFPDGVYFVPLAEVRTADVMWTTIAESLGVVLDGSGSAAVTEHLGARRVLLVLDNLEQLADAASVVLRLLERAPGVQVLATSRRPLRVAGEHEVVVEPLPVGPVPPGADAGPAGGASGGGALELFVERVRLVRPDFTVTPDNVHDVRELCRRLDGLPLAIELVAARARLLGPRAMLARLDRVLALPRVTVDGPERQHTLRHALDWSLQLLRPEVRTAFRRLGACDGDFSLAAAGAVVEPDRGSLPADDPWGDEGGDVLDVVAELVDASLLTVREGPDGEPRLAMLRTVALYARELLAADDDAEQVRTAHAEHHLRVAEEASRQLRQAQHLAGRSRLERELPNLRAALAWSLGEPDDHARSDIRLTLGLRLCEQLSWFWYGCGYAAEGRRWLEAAVRASRGTATPEAVAALHALGVLVMQQGDGERARDLLETCLAYRRTSGDASQLADELNSLGLACRASGDPGRARALAEEAVAVARRGGHERREANAVTTLAILAIDADRGDEAVGLLRRCLELDTSLGDVWGQAADHLNLASALLRAGRLEEAHAHLLGHAADAVRLGDWELSVDVLDLFCAVHAERRDADRAARLLGATVRMRQEHELPLAAPDARWFEGVLAPVRDRPDPGTWRRNLALGARWDVETALADAMEPRAAGAPPAAEASR